MITVLTREFWESAKKRQLVFQYCSTCNALQAYPKPWCSECGSEKLSWKELSGKGTVYSYTVPRQVVDNSPAFEERLPFVVAVVQLEEGPRLISNIVGLPPEEIRIGMKVKVCFEDVSPEIALPKFHPLQLASKE
jgi:uncharacterized OB-fold protein